MNGTIKQAALFWVALLIALAAGIALGAKGFSTHTTTTRQVQISWHDGSTHGQRPASGNAKGSGQ